MLLRLLLLPAALAYELATSEFNLELIDSQFQQLQAIHKTPCVQTAISSFILECKEKGADFVHSEVRILLAVKLSICEFEETGVEYPELCRNPPDDSYTMCIQAFRENSQLWTTYSGNYRKLRSICFEESFPFMKNHVIDLFHNITRIYSDLFREGEKAKNKTRSFHTEAERKMILLLQLLTLGVEQNEKQNANLKETFNAFETSMTTGYTHIKSEIDHIVGGMYEDISQFKHQMHSMNHIIMEMASRYSVVDSQIAEHEVQLLNNFEKVSERITHDLARINDITGESANKALVLGESLSDSVSAEDRLRNNLFNVSNQIDAWVTNLDLAVNLLYVELAQRFTSKADSFATTFELQLQQIINGTNDFKHQIQIHLNNVTDTLIEVESHISKLGLSLLMPSLFGSIRSIKIQLFSLFKLIAIMALTFIAILKFDKAVPICLSFIFAMIPGVFAAIILRAAVEAFWR